MCVRRLDGCLGLCDTYRYLFGVIMASRFSASVGKQLEIKRSWYIVESLIAKEVALR